VTWWSVLIELSTSGGTAAVITDEMLDDLMDAVAVASGSVLAEEHRYSARLAVNADSAPQAMSGALTILSDAIDKSGAPRWPIVRLDAMTFDELERDLERTRMPDLVGAGEVCELLGVSRQRLHQIRHEKADFPKPIVELAAGPLWTRPAIESWASTWDRRPGRRVQGSTATEVDGARAGSANVIVHGSQAVESDEAHRGQVGVYTDRLELEQVELLEQMDSMVKEFIDEDDRADRPVDR
jgi:predicted DNA-binding transcriptional regulator AlpA